jgi:protein gp37
MADLFHEDVPTPFIDKVFFFMRMAPQHTFQVLTKRPERMQKYVGMRWTELTKLPNLWLGVTAENQRCANERIPLLLQTPAALRFVSVEPMLEGINMRTGVYEHAGGAYLGTTLEGISWVICGPENGPKARPFEFKWAAYLYEQCGLAGTPFFWKGKNPILPQEFPAAKNEAKP